MVLLCGIDEAGRGPIIGPLVMCGVLIGHEAEKNLANLGVRDSKLLTRERRDFLFDKIKNISKRYEIIVINPDEIDRAVNNQDGLNLNRLEARKSAEILNKLKPEKAIVDAPSNNISSYKEYLLGFVENKKIRLVLEHKADLNYVIVGAASVLAKVTRDNEVDRIKKEIGIDFGSGYMSDPKTVAFLEKHYEDYSHLFRKSWFPYQDIMNKRFQKKLEDFSQFIEKAEDKNAGIMDKLKKLEDLGYKFVPTSTEHEHVRMKGPCAITLYKNGKLLVQGKEEDKKYAEKLLK